MARRIVILCDVCSQKDINAEAAEETITLNTLKPRIIALCESCRKELLEPLEIALKELGQVVSSDLVRQPAKQAPMLPGMPTVRVACPVKGCDAELKNESSLLSHARSAHDLTKAQVVALQEGRDLDEEPQGPAPDVTRAECDFAGCDVVYEWPKDPRPTTALGVHRRMKHGLKSGEKTPTSKRKK